MHEKLKYTDCTIALFCIVFGVYCRFVGIITCRRIHSDQEFLHGGAMVILNMHNNTSYYERIMYVLNII